MEEDSKVVDSVTSILLMGLTNTKDPEVFRRLMQFSMQAALDARYSRPKPSAPHGSDGAASGTLAHHIFQGTVHSSPPALPLLANDSTSMTDERAYSSYARVSTTAACLFCVLQRRMANTGYAGDDEYVQSSSIIIELANALLDLLESDHMFPSVQRDILSRFFRLHADSSSKLYFLQHGRDTVMDERVNLHENARFKLVSTRGAASGDSSSQQAAAVKFPVSRYVSILTSLFASSADLETYYALCQGLMQQLGNTYLFTICPEEMQALIVYLISHLRVATYSQDARVRLSAEEKNKVSAFSYGLLISAMHYKDLLKRDQQDALIAAFRDGLIVSSNASATPQICLHALSVSMLELPGAMVRLLSSILQQLVKIYSTPQISVHLLEFVSAISREQRLYANFRAQDYRMIFAVAINYIRFHNNQRRRENAPPTPVPGAGGAGAPKPGDSGVSPAVDPKRLSVGGGSASDSTSAKPSASDVALSQYVLVMAYQVIDVYYLSLSPSLKAETVNSLLQGLLQANLSRDSLDEANEVCLDMILQNFNKSSEDILSQGDVATKEDLGPVAERTWIQHNGIVTIRAQKSGPLAQIMVRSPSGTTSRVVDLPAEVARKYAERADLPTQSPPTGPATTADASVATTGATTPSGDAAAMPHSSPASTISRGSGRGRGTVRNRRLHSIAGPGAAGLGEADMLPPDTIARLLRGELAAAQSATSRAAHFPIRFGPAPCVAQEFITAYPMLQNIDPPVLLPTQSEAVSRSLRIFDITSTVDTHKVSVAYVGPGQTTEHEILLNQQGSPAYWNFLRGLGKITRLSGMKGYSAGLDTTGQDQDGRYTIKWRDLIAQLVFHVGTLMPAGETMSERMVRKKAHMGNDYVHIVFNESGRDYEFDTIPSEFNYVQIIVTPVDGRIPSHEVDSSWLHSDPGGAEAKFVQLYKVKTQVNANVPFVGPAMEPKLLTLTALPAFVRSVAIHAAIISQVYSDCKRNGGVGEFISPWRARLQAIKRIRSAAEREAAKQQQQSASAQSPAGSPLLDEKEEWPAGLHAPASQVLDHLTRELESFYNRA
ncbi:hypothetical protein GQ54DRAFT_298650 [Martensiomyces pterosporus]|nr:hypothetical protein GQ54DRAFT_298650 [Martensiomyces pterosporus]